MTSKEDLTNLCNKIDDISALAIKNAFMPFEIAKDVDCIINTLNQIKKDLEDFEWLKSKLNLTFLDSLSSPEDKERLLEIMGVKISYDKQRSV